MLGGAFDDIKEDLGVGRSMSRVPAGVSAAVTEANVRPAWKFHDGMATSDWMHLKKDGKGDLVSVEDVTAPEGGKCLPLEPRLLLRNFVQVTITLRVQVPNNHILPQILTQITTIRNQSTLLLGPLDP